ncbi:hypothetical protein MKEN_00456200 [Mycena kentingensis (nom. inval.)]|nr:hypothetical protein MKEN_00456200 [Mycena kentingensis (nom. inval.)]
MATAPEDGSDVEHLLQTARENLQMHTSATLDTLGDALRARTRALADTQEFLRTTKQELTASDARVNAMHMQILGRDKTLVEVRRELMQTKGELALAEEKIAGLQEELQLARNELELAQRDGFGKELETFLLHRGWQRDTNRDEPQVNKRPIPPEIQEVSAEDGRVNKRQRVGSTTSQEVEDDTTFVAAPSSNDGDRAGSLPAIYLSSPPSTPILPNLSSVQRRQRSNNYTIGSDEQQFVDQCKIAGVRYNDRLQVSKPPNARSKLATLLQQGSEWANLKPTNAIKCDARLADAFKMRERNSLAVAHPRIFLQNAIEHEPDGLTTRRRSQIVTTNGPTRAVYYTYASIVAVDRVKGEARLDRRGIRLHADKPILTWGFGAEENDLLAVVFHDENAKFPVQVELRPFYGKDKEDPPQHPSAKIRTLKVSHQSLPPGNAGAPPVTACEIADEILALSVCHGSRQNAHVFLYAWMHGVQISQHVLAGAVDTTFLDIGEDSHTSSRYLITLGTGHNALDIYRCPKNRTPDDVPLPDMLKYSFRLPAPALGSVLDPDTFRVHAQRAPDGAKWASEDYFVHDHRTACIFVSYETKNVSTGETRQHILVVQRQPFIEILAQAGRNAFTTPTADVLWVGWSACATVLDGDEYRCLSPASLVGQRILGLQAARDGAGSHLCMLDFNARKVAQFEAAFWPA